MGLGTAIPVTMLNIGFLGEVSRTADPPVIVAREASPANTLNINFGDTCVLIGNTVGGYWQSVADFIAQSGSFTLAKFAGIAVREVKTMLGYPYGPAPAGNGYYAPGQIAEVLERGSITVKINVTTGITAGGTVYIRTVLNGAIPAGVVGGLEAQADGSNTVALTGTEFRTGVVDSNNMAEITILSRTVA